jgi:hypothetical protein
MASICSAEMDNCCGAGNGAGCGASWAAIGRTSEVCVGRASLDGLGICSDESDGLLFEFDRRSCDMFAVGMAARAGATGLMALSVKTLNALTGLSDAFAATTAPL